MAAHIAYLHAVKRDDLQAPTADGVAGALTKATNAPLATNLAFDTTTPKVKITQSIPPLADIPLNTPLPSDPPTSPPVNPTPAGDTTQNSSGAKVIPMSLVLGACIGAVAGAIVIVLLGWLIFKRTAPKRKGRQPHSMSADRNARGEMARTRSRMEKWNELGDDEDKWETKEVSGADGVAPMEKLTMFKKSTPSVRTAYTHKSIEPPVFNLNEPHPFASPHLAVTKPSDDPPFLGRVDAGPALSWDSDALGTGSFLTLHSRLSGAMSPTTVAIPTPHVTSSEVHHWESAEVLNFDEPVTEDKSNNPFNETNRRSAHNPFFNATSSMPVKGPSPKGKGKEREQVPTNPFADTNTSIPEIKHVPQSSVSSNDRALQNLIAALDLNPSEVEERLRVASMQPSVMSATSVYTNDLEEVTEFPLPPGFDHSQSP